MDTKMNRRIYILVSLLCLAVCSCDRQDDTYRQYIVPGGYNYPAKVQEVQTLSGYLKVELSWAVPLDPAVKLVRLYWDSGRDSLSLDYAAAENGRLSARVENLEDRSYTFSIVNFDESGNRSLPYEITVSPYGDGWLSTHAERRVVTAEMRGSDAVITMGTPIGEMTATKFRYRNSAGNVVVLNEILNADENSIRLPDALKGKFFEYQSSYCPENGIDTVWTNNWVKSAVPISYNIDISKAVATVTANQTRSPYLPQLAIDGITDSDNHKWMSTNDPSYQKVFPKIFVIDTNETGDDVMTFSTFRFYQNPDDDNKSLRRIRTYEIYVSDDPLNPNTGDSYAAVFGTPLISSYLSQLDAVQEAVPSELVSGRYIAIVFKNSYDNTNGFLDLYEFEAYGYAAGKTD